MEAPKWILVVDDDDDNRESVIELLEHEGYTARGANGGAAALALLREDRPCLVLADLRMKGMDGKELLVRAHELLDPSTPPFLFVSGIDPSQAGDLGAPILKKPIDFAQLLGAVKQHCPPS